MPVTLTAAEQTALEAAAAAEKGVRRWKRYRAVLLRAEGKTVAAVADALRCSQASVYAWTAAWRRHGVAGLREGDHGGGQVKLGAAGGGPGRRRCWPATPRQRGYHATGWTVPLLSRPVGTRGGSRSASGLSGEPCIGGAGAGSGPSTCSADRTPTTRRKRGGSDGRR